MSSLTPPPARLESGLASGGRSAAEVEAGDFTAFKECQSLLKERLAEPLLKLFAELTGLQLHVFWHQPLDSHPPGERPVLCPAARRVSDSGAEPAATCQACRQRHWSLTALAASDGRRFVGLCGATNLCVSFQMANARPLTLMLQMRTMNRDSAPKGVGRPSRRALDDSGPAGTSLHPATAGAFDRAEALLRFILHDLEATFDTRLAQREQDGARGRLRHLEAECARLRAERDQRFPELPAAQAQPAPGSHAQHLVQAMLDYVHQHYHRPMSLKDVAASLRMHPDYLAHLFSHTVGLKFHDYLQELRLAKAEELLREPRQQICDVACAVGFASAHHFRHAFKARLGVSPAAWRSGH